MRDYKKETEERIAFIRSQLKNAGADGIIYGNSGGKDCTLVGILCKMACENTEGIIMPCQSKRNYDEDMRDGLEVSKQYGIKTRIIDISGIKEAAVKIIGDAAQLNDKALMNINPRLRMITLYAVGAAENRLVAGTGNRSEAYMGYFTKWGDGAYDFNPISDLTVTEIYEFLAYLGAPENVRTKAPSAGLFEGQTDENEMGISYADIDKYILTGEASEKNKAVLEKYHRASEHKRQMPAVFKSK